MRLRHIIALHHFPPVGLTLVAALLSLPPSRGLFVLPLEGAVRACLGLFGSGSIGALP